MSDPVQEFMTAMIGAGLTPPDTIEADVKSGKVAITAPLARALIGKEVGDTAVVRSPKGAREYDVLAVKFVAQDDAEGG